jgi:hypothetical protein
MMQHLLTTEVLLYTVYIIGQCRMWLQKVGHKRQCLENVWCAILKDKIIGPHFTDGKLKIQKYAVFDRHITTINGRGAIKHMSNTMVPT